MVEVELGQKAVPHLCLSQAHFNSIVYLYITIFYFWSLIKTLRNPSLKCWNILKKCNNTMSDNSSCVKKDITKFQERKNTTMSKVHINYKIGSVFKMLKSQ